jgi:hypothetical protein
VYKELLQLSNEKIITQEIGIHFEYTLLQKDTQMDNGHIKSISTPLVIEHCKSQPQKVMVTCTEMFC